MTETFLDRSDLAERMARLAGRHGVPGAQLAVRHAGRTVTVETGEESVGSGRRVTERSAFPLGSLTKPFTATLAMMLVDDGDVDLDAPLAKYLPELGSAMTPAGRVTLRQVLAHTAGLAATVEEMPPGATRRRWVDKHGGASPPHPPGAVFSYSNVGYLLVAHLVEVITGMSWRQAVESILLRPLGIAPLFVVDGPPRTGARSLVNGHVIRPHSPVLPIGEQSVPPLEEPVAGLAVSAADVAEFVAALLPGSPGRGLMDRATARQLWSDQLGDVAVGPFGLADGWGLGWSLYRDVGREWFGHDGTGDGAWSHVRAEPVDGTVVALTTNGSTGVAMWEDLVEEFRSAGLVVGNHSLAAPVDLGPAVSAPAGCVGRYANGSWTCSVEDDGGDLYLTVGSEPRLKLAFHEGLRFMTTGASDAASMPYAGRFVRDPATGNVDLLQLTGRLAARCG